MINVIHTTEIGNRCVTCKLKPIEIRTRYKRITTCSTACFREVHYLIINKIKDIVKNFMYLVKEILAKKLNNLNFNKKEKVRRK